MITHDRELMTFQGNGSRRESPETATLEYTSLPANGLPARANVVSNLLVVICVVINATGCWIHVPKEWAATIESLRSDSDSAETDRIATRDVADRSLESTGPGTIRSESPFESAGGTGLSAGSPKQPAASSVPSAVSSVLKASSKSQRPSKSTVPKSVKEPPPPPKPVTARELASRANASFQSGDFSEANRQFAKAVEINLSDASLRESFAKSLFKSGRIKSGIEQLNAAIRLKPDEIRFRQMRGLAFLQIGDAAAAKKDAEKLFESASKKVQSFAFNVKGKALLLDSNETGAMTNFLQAIQQDLTNVDAHLNAAQTSLSLAKNPKTKSLANVSSVLLLCESLSGRDPSAAKRLRSSITSLRAVSR